MRIERVTESEDMRRFWAFVDRAAAEVATWPAWMKGGPLPAEPPTTLPGRAGKPW